MKVNRQFQEKPSDLELVHLVKSGDATAFDALSDRYMPLVTSRAGRYAGLVGSDLEDFVQEGLLALFRAAKGFDPASGTKFITYATACIQNSMSDAIKAHMKNARKNGTLCIDDISDQQLQAHYTADKDIFASREDASVRQRQIEALLSDFERQVLGLYLKGHTYQQISVILSTATKSVDNALQRVRRKLNPGI